MEHSRTLRTTIQALSSQPRDRAARVLSFVNDLNTALEVAAASIQPNGYLIWTLGNRHVGNREIPLHQILKELLLGYDCSFVASIDRDIPTKRMASRNCVSDTIRHERVMILRKESAGIWAGHAHSMKGTVNVDANVIRQLGEELVTDAEQAILELIKNSYDADAASVRLLVDTSAELGFPHHKAGLIRVEDNGCGMTLQELHDGWLRISLSLKREFKALGKKSRKGADTAWG